MGPEGGSSETSKTVSILTHLSRNRTSLKPNSNHPLNCPISIPKLFFRDPNQIPTVKSNLLTWPHFFPLCFLQRLDKFAELAPADSYDVHYGQDGTGDIYNRDNMECFRSFVLAHTEGGEGVHSVMADGGFGVQGQEHMQEHLSRQLILCQLSLGISLLRESPFPSQSSLMVCLSRGNACLGNDEHAS